MYGRFLCGIGIAALSACNLPKTQPSGASALAGRETVEICTVPTPQDGRRHKVIGDFKLGAYSGLNDGVSAKDRCEDSCASSGGCCATINEVLRLEKEGADLLITSDRVKTPTILDFGDPILETTTGNWLKVINRKSSFESPAADLKLFKKSWYCLSNGVVADVSLPPTEIATSTDPTELNTDDIVFDEATIQSSDAALEQLKRQIGSMLEASGLDLTFIWFTAQSDNRLRLEMSIGDLSLDGYLHVGASIKLTTVDGAKIISIDYAEDIHRKTQSGILPVTRNIDRFVVVENEREDSIKRGIYFLTHFVKKTENGLTVFNPDADQINEFAQLSVHDGAGDLTYATTARVVVALNSAGNIVSTATTIFQTQPFFDAFVTE